MSKKAILIVLLFLVFPFIWSNNDEMVFIKGGSFNMGSKDGEKDERPVHKVILSDFYIGKFEVTQALYKKVMGKNPSKFKGDKNPVEMVNWLDAVKFCNKYSKMNGYQPVYKIDDDFVIPNWKANGYRLPTEAEWEYVARNRGENVEYPWGKGRPLIKGKKAANVADLTAGKRYKKWIVWDLYNDGFIHTSPVGAFLPNKVGVYDIIGNVWEWCWDYYSDDYYKKSVKKNPHGEKFGAYRVVRGGSWRNKGHHCSTTYRGSEYENSRYSYLGFRIARNAK